MHEYRCTDGVWMSARVVREEGGAETLVVFLDCEGIGSPERQETEDMLHCLLVGAVSSLTMFKTHFAFGKYEPHNPILIEILCRRLTLYLSPRTRNAMFTQVHVCCCH